MNINITANNSSVSNHSQVIGSVNENNVRQAHQGQEEEILNELRAIREKLASAEELSSQLAALEQAIRESNQPKIRDIVRQLTTDFSSSLLSSLASGGVLALLGV